MEKEVALDFFIDNNIFTIGYEGKDIDKFITKLKQNNVSTLIDIREIPLSRKKGFSKTALQQSLKQNNINYLHIKELGSPKQLRNKLREDKDFNYFSKEFNKHLKIKESMIKTLHKKILAEKCCLMCFEKNHEFCHRSLITNEIKRIDNNGLKIINL